MDGNKTKKVLVAMSGGVDSAVAARLIKDMGYETAGVTMSLWSEREVLTDSNSPTVDQNVTDAKAVADAVGIEHYSVTLGESFRECVIDNFLEEYKRGRTPNPCVECNRTIKFGKLFEVARELGYDTLATGHYAVIEKQCDRYYLKKAADSTKDQSYFLWSLSRHILPNILFPLGNMTKSEIREIAARESFVNAHRSDSQDICFIPDGDYVSFIEKNSDIRPIPGAFLDARGNEIGTHGGIIRYTIGQRKGLGVAFGQPMFVGKKDAEANTVTLCTDKELFSHELTARNVNLLSVDSMEGEYRLHAKIRYRHTPAPATVSMLDDGRLRVVFDEPQRAISPGQSLVLYDGDTVFGGGIIE